MAMRARRPVTIAVNGEEFDVEEMSMRDDGIDRDPDPIVYTTDSSSDDIEPVTLERLGTLRRELEEATAIGEAVGIERVGSVNYLFFFFDGRYWRFPLSQLRVGGVTTGARAEGIPLTITLEVMDPDSLPNDWTASILSGELEYNKKLKKASKSSKSKPAKEPQRKITLPKIDPE